MARVRAAHATVKILDIEGVTHAFGLPGAALNPFYSAQRGFDMDYCVQLAYDKRQHARPRRLRRRPRQGWRVRRAGRCRRAGRKLMAEHEVPVVVEVILERVTDIAMGADLDAVTEFEELATSGAHAPTALLPLG